MERIDMSYAETIQKILSDGRWHCVLDLIAETGLSARNRISELNKEHELKYSKKRYLGSKCKLSTCDHRSDLYMYKLNNGDITGMNSSDLNYSFSIKDLDNQDEINKVDEEWNNKTPEERHEYIKNLKKEFGL